jgi:hypothetical protein
MIGRSALGEKIHLWEKTDKTTCPEPRRAPRFEDSPSE